MKKKKLVIVTIIYTIIILYFMYFGFDRLEHIGNYKEAGYEFLLIPSTVPLNFPRFTFSWVYDLGNIVAFIPFGILIPLLKKMNYRKFISYFIIMILGLEVIQTLTYTGAFDVDDVISNTIGATIGYIAYKIGFSSKVTLKKLIYSGLSIIMLICCVISVSEILDKRVSSIKPLQDIKEDTGSRPLTNNIQAFTIGGEKIEPQFNLYSNMENIGGNYTYTIEGKEDIILYLNIGVPDYEEPQGEMTIVTDGEVRYQTNAVNLKETETIEKALEIPLYYTYKKMTITITGNIKLWDVRFTELKHWWE